MSRLRLFKFSYIIPGQLPVPVTVCAQSFEQALVYLKLTVSDTMLIQSELWSAVNPLSNRDSSFLYSLPVAK